MRVCWGCSTSCFLYYFVFQVITEKHCVAKISQGIWEGFLNKNNRIYNSYKFSYKFAFIPCLFLRRKQKQESNFQKVGDLVTRNISVTYLWRLALYFKGMPNSIDLYKRIFLRAIPVRMISSMIIYSLNAIKNLTHVMYFSLNWIIPWICIITLRICMFNNNSRRQCSIENSELTYL